MAGELVYRVNGTSAVTMATSTLEAAGLRERQHLQEWVLANPEILGEDVLIVTSEFDQWFSKEGRDPDRLDVLGLGQDGRLVVAELKRDLTPDLVTMQAINYAARASRFTPTCWPTPS
jgi:RecB family endonuclease NucS